MTESSLNNLWKRVVKLSATGTSRFLMYAFIPWPALLGQNTSLLQDGTKLQIMLEKDCKKPGKVFSATIVHSDPARQKGLSDRHNQLAKNETMIFVFDRAEPVGFWMKRTFIPLQLIFIKPDGKTFGALEMPVEPNPDDPLKIYNSPGPTIAALELAPHTVKSPNGRTLCVEVPGALK